MKTRPTPWSDLDHAGRESLIVAAAEALDAGGLVVAPTDTVYGVFARADLAGAVAAFRKAVGQSDTAFPLTWHADDLTAIEGLSLPTTAHRRLIASHLPGPIRFDLEQPADRLEGLREVLGIERGVIDDGQRVGFRIPDHGVFERLVAEAGGPLVATRLDAAGWGEDGGARVGDRAFEEATAVIDAGRLRPGLVSTTVEIDLTGAFRVSEGGAVDEAEIMDAMTRTILFVCTGNTCRSPMAEAVARGLVAQRKSDGLTTIVGSAGVATSNGGAATPEAVEAMRARGLDLSRHASRRLTPELVREAEVIYAMTPSHLDAVLSIDPSAEGKAFTLDPSGRAIDDPIGGPQELYDSTAERLEALIAQRLEEIEP